MHLRANLVAHLGFGVALLTALCGGITYAFAEESKGDYLSAEYVERLCKGEHAGTFFQTREGVERYCLGFVSAVAEAYDRGEAKGGWRYCLPANTLPNDV